MEIEETFYHAADPVIRPQLGRRKTLPGPSMSRLMGNEHQIWCITGCCGLTVMFRRGAVMILAIAARRLMPEPLGGLTFHYLLG